MVRKGYPFSRRRDKKMTNLVSGLLTGIIFAPFAIVDLLGNTASSNIIPSINDEGCKPIDNNNQYDNLLKSIIKKSSNPVYDCIRNDYYEIIKSNNKIHPEIIKLQKKIALHQKEIEQSLIGKTYHTNVINKALQEIKDLELKHPKCKSFSLYKDPIITIENISNDIGLPYFEGYVYLEINKIISNDRPLHINERQLLIDKGKTFFNVNRKPLKPLLGKDIEILFYDKFLMLLTHKDFSFVDYKDIKLSYTKIILEICSNFGTKLNPLNERALLNKYDSISNVKLKNTKEYAVIEAGLLELEVCTQKINLLFTKFKEGKMIYSLINNQ